jgi:hypothetical protein
MLKSSVLCLLILIAGVMGEQTPGARAEDKSHRACTEPLPDIFDRVSPALPVRLPPGLRPRRRPPA